MKTKILTTFAWLFSAFSILSSLSLIREVNRLGTEWYVTLFLTAFLLTFVLFVEYFKVIEIRRKFNQSPKANLIMLLFTFTISIGSSGVGVWFWTDQSQKINSQLVNEKVISTNRIESIYNHRIDSLSNLSITNLQEFQDLSKIRRYWEGRTAIDSSDLRLIRSAIVKVNNQLETLSNHFYQSRDLRIEQIKKEMDSKLNNLSLTSENKSNTVNRGNTVTFIFLMLILIIEFLIVMVHKELCSPEKFRLQEEHWNLQRLINHLQVRGFCNKTVDINEIKYSPFMQDYKDFEQVKKVYNLLIDIGVIANNGYLSLECNTKLNNYYKVMIKYL